MNRTDQRERGAILVLGVIVMSVLIFMTAFAVDVGALFVERREDQSAVDFGVLGGALDLTTGLNEASEGAAELIRGNLDTTYTDAQWAAQWASCTDPGALRFKGTVLATPTSCISSDGLETFRITLPDQEIDTILAGVLGIESFTTSARSEATVAADGVLPLAVLGSAASGSEMCLRSSAGGTATPPCTGSDSGNFGGLEVPQWGNPVFGTEGLACNLNKSDQLFVNISAGIDHLLRIWDGTDVVDDCAKPFGPNTLPSFQGISGGLFEGMISGDVVVGLGFSGRLSQGTTAKINLTRSGSVYPIDNVPLWKYIGLGKAGTVPDSCTRESLDATATASGYPAAEAQMATCLTTYAAGSGFAELFDADADNDDTYDIVGSPRYGIVPQFVETAFGSGASSNLHIADFRALFINGLYFGCNGSSCSTVVMPGANTGSVAIPGGSAPLDQVTGYLLPNDALPDELIENGVDGTLNAYEVSLAS